VERIDEQTAEDKVHLAKSENIHEQHNNQNQTKPNQRRIGQPKEITFVASTEKQVK
jgi:hypothetical protein